MKVLFDTNILIDFTSGYEEARRVLRSHRSASISVISRIELLSGPVTTVQAVRDVLNDVETIQIDEAVTEAAAVVRRDTRLKLPDAVILATAQVHGLTLLTRDQRDFGGLVKVQIPYRL